MIIRSFGKISTPVLAFLTLILVGATAAFAQTPTLRANSKIAFNSDRDGNLGIYAMNADGTGQTELTTTALGVSVWYVFRHARASRL